MKRILLTSAAALVAMGGVAFAQDRNLTTRTVAPIENLQVDEQGFLIDSEGERYVDEYDRPIHRSLTEDYYVENEEGEIVFNENNNPILKDDIPEWTVTEEGNIIFVQAGTQQDGELPEQTGGEADREEDAAQNVLPEQTEGSDADVTGDLPEQTNGDADQEETLQNVLPGN